MWSPGQSAEADQVAGRERQLQGSLNTSPTFLHPQEEITGLKRPIQKLGEVSKQAV